MALVLIQGFLLGLAYVAPIGTQNIYVINSGVQLSKSKAYLVALIIVFFDITLAFACYYGIGLLLESNSVLKNIILLVGSLAMVIIGIHLIRAKSVEKDVSYSEQSIPKIVITAMVVTWFNPQAIIDGSLLLGGFRATLTEELSTIFILGVSLASLFWFLLVITLTSFMKKSFTTKTLKMISIVCGVVILLFAFKLSYSLLISLM